MFIAPLLALLILHQSPATAPATVPATVPTIGKCLVIQVPRSSRASILVDPIEAKVVAGSFTAPNDGEECNGAKWHAIEAKEHTFTDDALAGGWAYMSVDSPDDRVMILAAAGQSMTYVNNEPRGGDVYENGFVRLPIFLHAGHNDLLFASGRGRLSVELLEPRDKLYVESADATPPDFIRGVPEKLPMAALFVNATTQPATIESQTILPLSVRKIRKIIDYDGQDISKLDTDFAGQMFTFRVLGPTENRKRTFISDIDGSVQYYSIVPQDTRPNPPSTQPSALVLSLHGASVEATSQAGAYSSKSWANIVCPTNRRPYGFDWEDWGRIDALEVLADAQKFLPTDPSRVYLTGHSMGGHGTWQIGSIFPDRFAAIGVSAGWLSFSSYRDRPTTTSSTAPTSAPVDVQALLRRAGGTSETQTLMRNLEPLGVYILHGTDDDNVPFTEARQAVKILEGFHHDFRLHAQLKAGHWWDASDEPGTDCVDWAPMFDLFARHRLPPISEVREIDFCTFNPAVSSKCFWLSIDAQIAPLALSRVEMRCDPGARRFVGKTENVARLHLDLTPVPSREMPITIDIDGTKLSVLLSQTDCWLAHENGTWTIASAPDAKLKTPARSGPLKQAFNHRMLFVYGTRGNADENLAGFNKARFDSETWWYRGNGAVDVIPDTDDAWRDASRSVILYGNADTNTAWSELLRDSPIQVTRGKVRIGQHEETGDNLAAMFLRPRADSDTTLIGAIGGSGVAGLRLTTRIPVFTSGISMPDWIVFGPDVLEKGMRAAKGAGFFDNNWNISPTNSVLPN